MLQRGAAKVYAIDVGKGQLHWKLRSDPRVIVMEETNARFRELLARPDIDAVFIASPIVLEWENMMTRRRKRRELEAVRVRAAHDQGQFVERRIAQLECSEEGIETAEVALVRELDLRDVVRYRFAFGGHAAHLVVDAHRRAAARGVVSGDGLARGIHPRHLA